MAEVLGVVASGISVGSLAIQIIGSVQQMLDLWSTIKGAPEKLRYLLEELKIVGKILSELDRDSNEQMLTTQNASVMADAVQYCREAMAGVDQALQDLTVGMTSIKGRTRHWAAIKAAMKGKALEESIARLERAKSSLNLARHCYDQQCSRALRSELQNLQDSQTQVIENILFLRNNYQPLAHASISTADRGTNTTSLVKWTDCPDSTRRVLCSARNIKSYWFALGTLLVHSKATESNESADSMRSKEYEFRFVRWLSWRGYVLFSKCVYGLWQYSFRSYRTYSHKDPIFIACALGDVEQVYRLCVKGQATPFDTTYGGWSLLHVIFSPSSSV